MSTNYLAEAMHLAQIVYAAGLLTRAMCAMQALHAAASPVNESAGDLDARIPASVFTEFVDEHARLLHEIAAADKAAFPGSAGAANLQH